MRATKPKSCFERARFGSTKEWIYFCLEFDLEICDGCMARARRRSGSAEPWYCNECTPVAHPALICAIRTRQDADTKCHLCHEVVALSDCWISEDCQRLFCSKHLKPIADVDRPQVDRAVAELPPSKSADRQRWVVRESSHPVRGQGRRAHSFDTSTVSEGIYDGNRLIEFDRSERWTM